MTFIYFYLECTPCYFQIKGVKMEYNKPDNFTFPMCVMDPKDFLKNLEKIENFIFMIFKVSWIFINKFFQSLLL